MRPATAEATAQKAAGPRALPGAAERLPEANPEAHRPPAFARTHADDTAALSPASCPRSPVQRCTWPSRERPTRCTILLTSQGAQSTRACAWPSARRGCAGSGPRPQHAAHRQPVAMSSRTGKEVARTRSAGPWHPSCPSGHWTCIVSSFLGADGESVDFRVRWNRSLPQVTLRVTVDRPLVWACVSPSENPVMSPTPGAETGTLIPDKVSKPGGRGRWPRKQYRGREPGGKSARTPLRTII